MAKKSNESLKYLPLGIDVTGRKCVVVGGGTVGTRKVRTLVRTGADLTVVSPRVTDELAGVIEDHDVRWLQEPFRREHLEGAFLVVAATDDEGLNREIAGLAARQEGALVNEASSAEHSKVIFGALLLCDDAIVAVFTDGKDPSQARRTRDRIADLVDRGIKD